MEGVEVCLLSFFNLTARWGWVVSVTARSLYAREWESVSIVQEGVTDTENLVLPAFDPLTAQHAASRYTDYAISC